MFATNRIPSGWMVCEGQILEVSKYEALATLLGKYYGGDGKNTFALPDLRGRAMLGFCDSYPIGEAGGTEEVKLNLATMPTHKHNIEIINEDGTGILNSVPPLETLAKPVINGVPGLLVNSFTSDLEDMNSTTLHPESISSTGENIPHNNSVPYITLKFCIAIEGDYPQRA